MERDERSELTPEEVQQAREALERGQQHSREIMARRGGVSFSSSAEIIREMREERDRQLAEVMGWTLAAEESNSGTRS